MENENIQTEEKRRPGRPAGSGNKTQTIINEVVKDSMVKEPVDLGSFDLVAVRPDIDSHRDYEQSTIEAKAILIPGNSCIAYNSVNQKHDSNIRKLDDTACIIIPPGTRIQIPCSLDAEVVGTENFEFCPEKSFKTGLSMLSSTFINDTLFLVIQNNSDVRVQIIDGETLATAKV